MICEMTENYEEWYKKVQTGKKRMSFLQHKGSALCIDLYCECGNHYHYDGDFLYNWKCNKCGSIYASGDILEMYKVPKIHHKSINKMSCQEFGEEDYE